MPEPIPGAPVVARAFDSGELTFGESIEVRQIWVVTFAADEETAAAAVLTTVPPVYRSLPMSGCSLSSREGVHCWKYDVSYSSTRSKPISSVQANVEDPEISYQLGGEIKHITTALGTRGKDWQGQVVPGAGTARDDIYIGVKKDSVEGADIQVPIERFSETHYFLKKDLTRSVRSKWRNLFARTNNAPFRGYAADEVLFEGVQTTIKGAPEGVVPVTFQFAARVHQYDVDIGLIHLDEIKGWELVDIRYRSDTDTTAKRTVSTPLKVLLHQVYHSGNFADLGISTT